MPVARNRNRTKKHYWAHSGYRGPSDEGRRHGARAEARPLELGDRVSVLKRGGDVDDEENMGYVAGFAGDRVFVERGEVYSLVARCHLVFMPNMEVERAKIESVWDESEREARAEWQVRHAELTTAPATLYGGYELI